MTPTVDDIIIAVDGGQTATKALIATADGRVLAAGRGGPAVHFLSAGGVDSNRRAIQSAIGTAVQRAGVQPDRVASVCLGLTGVPAGAAEIELVREIVREIASPREVAVRADTETSLLGASGGRQGVVVIAGGGAIGYGLTADGREAISNGMGYLLGDEGSSFWIGKQAIRAACYARDGRGDPTTLAELVESHFGIGQMRDLPRVIYHAGFTRDRVSLLAPKVVDAAAAGDWAASGILGAAGEELGTTALGVLRQLHAAGENATVYPVGGLFRAGERVLTPFRRTILAGWPEAAIESPRFPPAVGGLIVAARAIGIPTGANWLARVEESLPGALQEDG